MDLEGNGVNSIIFGAMFGLILTVLYYIGINHFWKNPNPEKWNKPIVVFVFWLFITIITALRSYYNWL